MFKYTYSRSCHRLQHQHRRSSHKQRGALDPSSTRPVSAKSETSGSWFLPFYVACYVYSRRGSGIIAAALSFFFLRSALAWLCSEVCTGLVVQWGLHWPGCAVRSALAWLCSEGCTGLVVQWGLHWPGCVVRAALAWSCSETQLPRCAQPAWKCWWSGYHCP